VEPMHPKLRAALKQAHPGLTDQDIDRSEELLAQRMSYDPEKNAERIAELDGERMELIQRTMPRYAEIARIVGAEQALQNRATGPKYTVEIKSPKG